MCGTFTLAKPVNEVEKAFNVKYNGPQLPLRFNARPSQYLPIILNSNPRELVLVRWGFEPSWGEGGDIINARVETLSERQMFKEAVKQRRCLVPADGFYEWAKLSNSKVPHLFTFKNNELFSFAGLWREFKNNAGETTTEFVIITTKPNELVATVHDRMPAVLQVGQESEWLSGANLSLLTHPLSASYFKDTVLSTSVKGV